MEISSGTGSQLQPIQGVDSLRVIGKFIGFAILFNALLWLFGLFVQIRGWANDVTTSYIILAFMWVVGTLICLATANQLRLQRRLLATTIGSMVWAIALIGLNAVAPKPVNMPAAGTAASLAGSSEAQRQTPTSPTSSFASDLPPLSVSPTKLIFKDQYIGTVSDPQTVTVANRGSAPRLMSPPKTTGNFSQTNDCGPELMAGDSCSVAVTFAPTNLGLMYGSLVIASSDPLQSTAYINPATVTFSGSGEEQRKKPPATSAAQNEKPPTLMDLFNKDFSNMGGLTDKGFDLRSSDGETIHVNWRVVMDFSGKSDFVAFYIPSADHGFDSCLALADMVRPMITDLSKRIEVTGGDSGGVTSSRELTFSGRVFVYHEWPLSNKQKADIIEAYSAKGLDIQFRGIDYLGDKLITWHQQHDAKAAHR